MKSRIARFARRRAARGAVYVETLLCLVPLLTLFFGVVQLSFVASARLVVRHAAAQAARAAIVILEDDPERFGGAPRGNLVAGRPEGVVSGLRETFAPMAPHAPTSGEASTGGARLQAVREAAYVPLAALAPARPLSLGSENPSLERAIGESPLTRFALGYLLYNRAAAVVTLRAAPGSDDVLTSVGPRDDVTVHVTYLFYCGVPLASRLLCDPLWDLAGYGRVLDELSALKSASPRDLVRSMKDLKERLPAKQEKFARISRELERVESPELFLLLLFSGERFLAIEAEATLPNQGALYYAEESQQPSGR